MGRKYKNAPIIEALCEFQFSPTSPWDLAIPGLVYEKIQRDFPKRRQVKHLDVDVSAKSEGVEQEVRTTDRIQFLRHDEKALIQVSQNLLAVNHLRPYPTWEGFLPLIRKGFDAYYEVAKPVSIQRIGLRYINRIELPGPKVKLEDYLAFYAFLGPDLPQDHGPFIVGVDIPYENERDGLRLQMSSANSQKPGMLAILLDLDYSLRRPASIGFDATFGWIEIAHSRVEEVFEGCVTDTLRRQFDEVRD